MISLLFSLALAGPCELTAPPGQAYSVKPPPQADRVHVALTVRVNAQDVPWARGVATALTDAGVSATFSFLPSAPTPQVSALLVELKESGFDLAVRLPKQAIPKGFQEGPPLLRKTLRPFTKVSGKLTTIEAPLGDSQQEAVLHRTGFRAVLVSNGPAISVPRSELRFDGQPNNGVVLPRGPYAGACGTSPVTEGFNALVGDRITQALYGARSTHLGVVQIVLRQGSAHDAEELTRWITTIARPAGVSVGSAREVYAVALPYVRAAKGSPEDKKTGGRIVRVDQVREVASALTSLTTLPRELPHNLNPTEAFLAFLLIATNQIEGEVVRLQRLAGPSALNPSHASGASIDAQAAIDLAVALLDDLPDAIPSALSVDGQLLNAPELLSLYAAIVRGDSVLIPINRGVPEPNTLGLGWGESGTIQ